MSKTIAIFGSAFNPPHNGHADVISQALEWADQVLVVPNYKHAFGKNMLPYSERYTMTLALLEFIDHPNVMISNIEKQLAENNRGEPIYIYDVLNALSKNKPDDQLIFVVGPDNADPDTWKRFYRADDILKRWSIWPAKERLNIRSTQIRDLLTQGKLPSLQQCPPEVIHCLEHNILKISD